MAEASVFVAFFGGLLSLLSPCSALLLPAFFAYAFGSARELLGRTALFYLGLCVTLVPLGMGVSAVSSLFYGQRGVLIPIAGSLLIFFGLMQLFGRGFEIGPLGRLRGRVRGDSAVSVLTLGAVYGFAGFCSGPILGAVLTVAAASGGAERGAMLLAVYALGMAAPLFLMAALWDRFGLARRSWLRGREVSVGPLRVHSTSLISGALFIVLGVTFIAYEGTSSLSGLYTAAGTEEFAFDAQQWIVAATEGVPGWLLSAAALPVAIPLGWLVFRARASKRSEISSADGKVEETRGTPEKDAEPTTAPRGEQEEGPWTG
jgi:cytochrome c biogenesis protein CcdA